MIRFRSFHWRPWAARLALLLTLFATIQPALAALDGDATIRFFDFAVTAGAGGAPHNHNHTLCHNCAGHVCLEQHGAFDTASPPPAILPRPGTLIPPLTVSVYLWPHAPTAPPAQLIGRAFRARAPPLSA